MSQYDVFMYVNPSDTYSSCLQLGYTVTIGPIPAGTNMGFYVHSNGTRRIPCAVYWETALVLWSERHDIGAKRSSRGACAAVLCCLSGIHVRTLL